MKKSTKTLLVFVSLAYLALHGIFKLINNYYDWQHLGVIIAAILIAIGYFKNR